MHLMLATAPRWIRYGAVSWVVFTPGMLMCSMASVLMCWPCRGTCANATWYRQTFYTAQLQQLAIGRAQGRACCRCQVSLGGAHVLP